jgi:rubrerythrin
MKTGQWVEQGGSMVLEDGSLIGEEVWFYCSACNMPEMSMKKVCPTCGAAMKNGKEI